MREQFRLKNITGNFINFDLLKIVLRGCHSFKFIDITGVFFRDCELFSWVVSLDLSVLLSHKLDLRSGDPIILRELDPPTFCNGTRLVVKIMMPNLIDGTVLSVYDKRDVFLPRIHLIPTDITFPFNSLLFLVKLCFAASINKSQGQTLSITGIRLKEAFFPWTFLFWMIKTWKQNNLFVFTL